MKKQRAKVLALVAKIIEEHVPVSEYDDHGALPVACSCGWAGREPWAHHLSDMLDKDWPQ